MDNMHLLARSEVKVEMASQRGYNSLRGRLKSKKVTCSYLFFMVFNNLMVKNLNSVHHSILHNLSGWPVEIFILP